MAREITLADLRAAEAAHREAKAERVPKLASARGAALESVKDEHRSAAESLVAIRSAYRNQETAAGRRRGFVGGDAFITGIDCDVCGETFPPAELDRHIMVQHMSKKG